MSQIPEWLEHTIVRADSNLAAITESTHETRDLVHALAEKSHDKRATIALMAAALCTDPAYAEKSYNEVRRVVVDESLTLYNAVEAALDAKSPDVYADIRAERARQDGKHGGPQHDDTHNAWDWQGFREIRERIIANDLDPDTGFPDHLDSARNALVEIAALAVAQIESLDRAARA